MIDMYRMCAYFTLFLGFLCMKICNIEAAEYLNSWRRSAPDMGEVAKELESLKLFTNSHTGIRDSAKKERQPRNLKNSEQKLDREDLRKIQRLRDSLKREKSNGTSESDDEKWRERFHFYSSSSVNSDSHVSAHSRYSSFGSNYSESYSWSCSGGSQCSWRSQFYEESKEVSSDEEAPS